MSKYNDISSLLKATCNAIRDKDGTTELIKHEDIPERIEALNIDKNIGIAADWKYLFYDNVRLEFYEYFLTHTSRITGLIYAFSATTNDQKKYHRFPENSKISVDISQIFDKVTGTIDARGAFENPDIIFLNCDAFDASKVRDLKAIFKFNNCVKHLDISKAKGSKDLYEFAKCSTLESIELGSISIFNFYYAFYFSLLKSIDLSNIIITTKSLDMTNTFAQCYELERIEGLDLSNISTASISKIFGTSLLRKLNTITLRPGTTICGNTNKQTCIFDLSYIPNLSIECVKQHVSALNAHNGPDAAGERMILYHPYVFNQLPQDLIDDFSAKGYICDSKSVPND